MKKKKIKALVLLSGGLDSTLVAKLLSGQGIEVEAINFRTNFCGPSKARSAAQMLGRPLREVDIREDFLAVLKKPKYGYGTGMNPCIDCHALMLKKAAEIIRKEGFDLVATGEVLGERPMSQHKQALKIVEKESGLEGYLLRPLSAKLLEPTILEKQGLIEREKLLDIFGRSRKRQMALAKKFNIKNYPTPAGGCALTEKGFTRRLKELMEHKPDFNSEDIDLIRIGRHFWVGGEYRNTFRQAQGIKRLLPERSAEGTESKAYIQIILGRDEQENQILESLFKKDDILVEPDNFVGPTALIRGEKKDNSAIEKAKELIIKFSPKARNLEADKLTFRISRGSK